MDGAEVWPASTCVGSDVLQLWTSSVSDVDLVNSP